MSAMPFPPFGFGPPSMAVKKNATTKNTASSAARLQKILLTTLICRHNSSIRATYPLFHMTNKICLVTGATRGIGRAIAKMLLNEGAQVAICGRDQNAVDKAVTELYAETGGKVAGKAADV